MGKLPSLKFIPGHAASHTCILSSRFMIRKARIFLMILLGFFAGCNVSHVYYMSPLDINSNYYHSIPTHSDSSKSGIYGSLSGFNGNSNYQGRDDLHAIQASVYRSNNFGHFQTYYGLDFSIGSYHVGSYSIRSLYGGGLYDSTIQITPSLQKSFGSYGFNGGLDYVVPLPYGGEWRIIGIETSLQGEFGSYLSFRKSLPDSGINILATYNWTNTIGGTTEFVWVRKSGIELGYKISLGATIFNPMQYTGDKNADVPFYFSHTFHFTRGKCTGFWQLNFGSHTDSFQMGLNYRLGKSKNIN